MKKSNLYLLSRSCHLSTEEFNKYYNAIYTSTKVHIKPQEKEDLYNFVESITSQTNSIKIFDDFYFGYSIPQISKEFDLLKITKNGLLNIEFKSKEVNDDNILKQLKQNKYYCKSISNNIVNIAIISETEKIYILKNNQLSSLDINNLIYILNEFSNYEICELNINDLFKPSKYLVSPLNNPSKFINDSYFLTDHQQVIKNQILSSVERGEKYYKVSGKAGTGKTLLIYDIAKELTQYGKVCIVHVGNLCDGHTYLSERLSKIKIIPITALSILNFSIYKAIIIDESHRLKENQFLSLLENSKKYSFVSIFSIDTNQIMQASEISADIDTLLNQIENLNTYSLTEKIRTNKEISAFIKNLFDLSKRNTSINYENIEVLNASNIEEAKKILNYYTDMQYQFISYSNSRYNAHLIDHFQNGISTHRVIGQEFDNVVMMLDSDFYYKNGKLHSAIHPCPDYLFPRLLYQGITRVRSKLCLIILDNKNLFKNIINILTYKKN